MKTQKEDSLRVKRTSQIDWSLTFKEDLNNRCQFEDLSGKCVALKVKQFTPNKNAHARVSYQVKKFLGNDAAESLKPNCSKWHAVGNTLGQKNNQGVNFGLFKKKSLVNLVTKQLGKKGKNKQMTNKNKVARSLQNCAEFDEQWSSKQFPLQCSDCEDQRNFVPPLGGRFRFKKIIVEDTNSNNSDFSHLEEMISSHEFSELDMEMLVSGSQRNCGELSVPVIVGYNSEDTQETFFENQHNESRNHFNARVENDFQRNDEEKGRKKFWDSSSTCDSESSSITDLRNNNLNESIVNCLNETSVNGTRTPDKTLVLRELINREYSATLFDDSGHINSNALVNILLENLKGSFENIDFSFNNLSKTPLQIITENFVNCSKVTVLKDDFNLKKNLCLTSANICERYNQHRQYYHRVYEFYTEKLKNYSSKIIIILVVSMKLEDHFVSFVKAAFDVLSKRQASVVWIAFLAFFVFYVAEPSDCRFLEFWTNTARFFSEVCKGCSASSGFACLLSIFVESDRSEKWKIFEFINLIIKPPIQINITYNLLKPILNIGGIPSHFLTEAVASSLQTGRDIVEVFNHIIPKISLQNVSISTVELLFRFCEKLEEMNQNDFAGTLKHRLKEKVFTFKIKIDEHEYPFTASNQDEITRNMWETNALTFESSTDVVGEINNVDSETHDNGNGYEAEDNFNPAAPRTVAVNSNSLCFENGKVKSPILITVRKDLTREDAVFKQQLDQIKEFFTNRQFFSLGKYLNELMSDVLIQAAENILESLFQMKISLQQVVDVVKIMLLSCETENAATVLASISVTLILHLVKINEWDKAYALLCLCKKTDGKQIDLVKASVFTMYDDIISITQCRVALLLVEVYAQKENYKDAIQLIESHRLCSPKPARWNLTWSEGDEKVRIAILTELFENIISNQLSEMARDLFFDILIEQKISPTPLDLSKFADDVLTLLINQENEDAIHLYDKMKFKIELKTSTIRALLVSMVRHNFQKEAKNLLLSFSGTVYRLPDVNFSSVEMVVSSFWIEEEIYVLFDTLFDLVVSRHCEDNENEIDCQIHINVSLSDGTAFSNIKPVCLDLVDPSFDQICTRIERVLQYHINPPVKLIMKSKALQLDNFSLKRHLCSRKRPR